MTRIIFLLGFILIFVCLPAQRHKNLQEKAYSEADYNNDSEIYTSSASDRYDRKKRKIHPSYCLPSRKDILNFIPDYCILSETDNYSAYIDSIVGNTPYNDSIKKIEKSGIVPTYGKTEQVGGIYKGALIIHEKRGPIEAMIYLSDKFSTLFIAEPGIWIAWSNDSGDTWKHYFTGLYFNQPLVLKWYSKLPLIVDKHTLQIEAALVRQTPGYDRLIRKYELVKDGLVATFDLHTISKDSDQDGLTDIVENKFRTDPFNSDTNNNGIPDNLDMNPRKNAKRTENTIVFETLLDELFKEYTKTEYEVMLSDTIREKEINRDGGWSGILTNEPHAYCANDSTETIMIITDDPDITAIRPKYVRTIILSPTEYKESADFKFKTDLKIFSISPLFKADGYKDLYFIDFIDYPRGGRYLTWRTNRGWRINQGYSFIF